MSLRTLLSAALAVVAFGAVEARADFTVCNRSNQNASVAFGFLEEPRGWASAGWFNINPGACTVIYNGELKQRYYYVYATGNNGGVWQAQRGQNGGFFCTRTERFTLYNNEYSRNNTINCENAGFTTRQFLIVDTGDFRDFTFNLRN
jgi:uncharacterized membrane protein